MDHGEACCAPQFPKPAQAIDTQKHSSATADGHRIEQQNVPAGTFWMGDGFGDGNALDGERPVHAVTLDTFQIDATSVTNADFAAFADETGYRTEAEAFDFSAVFQLFVAADAADIIGTSTAAPWWFGVQGADWRHPEGRHSDLSGRANHPVVHVSWNDAQAYCGWAGRRLPTEAEWERASRGGFEGARFPWGDELLRSDGSRRANTWQGTFPTHNTREDGWLTTAPVRSFEPNSFGLWQTVGNVWEWCVDVFDARAYSNQTASVASARPGKREADEPKVIRGGSYLCHDSYCNRYRNSARSWNTPDSSMGHTGFRTAAL